MNRLIYGCCLVAAMGIVINSAVRADEPAQDAKAGVRVFHDRVVTFTNPQLGVLRDSGKWQGQEIGVAFLGINNRWDNAWELTQKNFEHGKSVIVVPTYNLPWEKMDLPGDVIRLLTDGEVAHRAS